MKHFIYLLCALSVVGCKQAAKEPATIPAIKVVTTNGVNDVVIDRPDTVETDSPAKDSRTGHWNTGGTFVEGPDGKYHFTGDTTAPAAPTKGTTRRRGKGRKKPSITSWDVTDWGMIDTGPLNSPLGWDIKTTHLTAPHDTVVIEGDVRFLRIGCCTYRIVRPEAYIEEVGGNPWTGFGIDEGPAGWGTIDGSRMPARLDSIKFPWSTDPPLAPYTVHYDSSSRMWIWGRNRGGIANDLDNYYYQSIPEIEPTPFIRPEPVRIFSGNTSLLGDSLLIRLPDTTSKKHPKKKP